MVASAVPRRSAALQRLRPRQRAGSGTVRRRTRGGAAMIRPAPPSCWRGGWRAPAERTAGRCGRGGPWTRIVWRTSSERGDLREELGPVDGLHDVVARALAHPPDLVGLAA